MFQRQWFTFVDAVPAEARRVRYWDQAATQGGGDYTVGALVAAKDGVFYVEDVVRGQWEVGERNQIRIATAERDKAQYAGTVRICLEQEPGSSGKEAAKSAIVQLAGHPVSADTVTGSKESRAEPLASQAAAGNVRVLRAKWNTAFLDELSEFPQGMHDDQVDATAGAFNKLAGRRSMTSA